MRGQGWRQRGVNGAAGSAITTRPPPVCSAPAAPGPSPLTGLGHAQVQRVVPPLGVHLLRQQAVGLDHHQRVGGLRAAGGWGSSQCVSEVAGRGGRAGVQAQAVVRRTRPSQSAGRAEQAVLRLGAPPTPTPTPIHPPSLRTQSCGSPARGTGRQTQRQTQPCRGGCRLGSGGQARQAGGRRVGERVSPAPACGKRHAHTVPPGNSSQSEADDSRLPLPPCCCRPSPCLPAPAPAHRSRTGCAPTGSRGWCRCAWHGSAACTSRPGG